MLFGGEGGRAKGEGGQQGGRQKPQLNVTVAVHAMHCNGTAKNSHQAAVQRCSQVTQRSLKKRNGSAAVAAAALVDGGKAPAGYMAGQAGRRTRTGWLCGACMVDVGCLVVHRGNSETGCLVLDGMSCNMELHWLSLESAWLAAAP